MNIAEKNAEELMDLFRPHAFKPSWFTAKFRYEDEHVIKMTIKHVQQILRTLKPYRCVPKKYADSGKQYRKYCTVLHVLIAKIPVRK